MNPSRNENDFDDKPFFPSNASFYAKFQQDDFKKFLLHDGFTIEGKNAIAKYYNVFDEWDARDHDVDFVEDYYKLLLLVKTKSDKDNVWISFIEGLHRHAAVISCLLCAKFDYLNNTLVPNSLQIDDFKTANIPHFKMPEDLSLTPKKILLNIINKKEVPISSMLTTPMSVEIYFPNKTNCDLKQLMDCCKKMSALISKNKRDSAIKSMPQETCLNLISIMACKTSTKMKNVDKHIPKFNASMRYQSHVQWKTFEKELIRTEDDNWTGYPDLLRSNEYEDYCKEPFDAAKRNAFLSIVSPASVKSNKSNEEKPPYPLSFNRLITSIDDYDRKAKTRSIDASHINAYYIIPILVISMTTKLKNENIYDIAQKNNVEGVGMIRFLTRYLYGTRKSPNVQLHGAIKHYCPSANDTSFIQGLSGIYRVIPVTLFLTTLYNSSFMFNTNSSDNLLVTALQRFDLQSNVGDEVFLNTMSKSIISAFFSKIEICVTLSFFFNSITNPLFI